MATNNKVLADSTKVAQDAAKMIGGTFEQGVGFTKTRTLNGGSTAPGAPQENTPGMSSGTTSAMATALEQRLMGAVDGISSSSTAIDTAIQSSIDAQNLAQKSGASRIEADYASEKASMQGLAQAKVDNFSDASRGFATQFAALRNLTDSTAKDLRDLEVRRQDALLANDSLAATNIAKLQMDKLDYEQKAKQSYYDNLLGLANYAGSQEDRAMRRDENAFQRDMSIKEYDLAITKDAREATYDEWKKQYDMQKFEFEKSSTLADQQMNQARTNIMLRELKLKEVEAGGGLNPDPGFATVSIQNSIGSAANTKLSAIQAKAINDASYLNSPQHEADTVAAYMELRREASTSQASDEALARTLGLTISDDKELSMIGVEKPETELPGDGSDALGNFFVASGMFDTIPVNRNFKIY